MPIVFPSLLILIILVFSLYYYSLWSPVSFAILLIILFSFGGLVKSVIPIEPNVYILLCLFLSSYSGFSFSHCCIAILCFLATSLIALRSLAFPFSRSHSLLSLIYNVSRFISVQWMGRLNVSTVQSVYKNGANPFNQSVCFGIIQSSNWISEDSINSLMLIASDIFIEKYIDIEFIVVVVSNTRNHAFDDCVFFSFAPSFPASFWHPYQTRQASYASALSSRRFPFNFVPVFIFHVRRCKLSLPVIEAVFTDNSGCASISLHFWDGATILTAACMLCRRTHKRSFQCQYLEALPNVADCVFVWNNVGSIRTFRAFIITFFTLKKFAYFRIFLVAKICLIKQRKYA